MAPPQPSKEPSVSAKSLTGIGYSGHVFMLISLVLCICLLGLFMLYISWLYAQGMVSQVFHYLFCIFTHLVLDFLSTFVLRAGL